MFNQSTIYYHYLDKALYFNTINYSQFIPNVLYLLSLELFLITAIIFYLCIIKNFNSFYVNSLFFYTVLILELAFSLQSCKFTFNYPTQLFFLSSFSFDFYSTFCKFFIILFLAFIIIFSELKFILARPKISDIYVPILFLLFFSLILLSACDFLLAYLSLEGVSLSLYVLAANTYHKRVAIEATVKYFVSGGVSSGLFIYGNSIVFGIFGTSNYIDVKHLISNFYAFTPFNTRIPIYEVVSISTIEVALALVCFIITFLFKVAAFPCHMWSPDVYDGLWLPITTILVVLVKLLYFLFFLKLFFYVFLKLVYVWQPALLLSSFGSLIVGSFGVLGQNKVKRIMAYSSITHVSFIILGMACGTFSGAITTVTYLLVYSFTLLTFFGFVLNTHCLTTGRSLIYLSDFSNLGSRGLLIVLFSMGGLPPFAGFFIKFSVYIEAIASGLYIFVILNLLITIIGTFYYLFFLKATFFDSNLWSKLVYLKFLRGWQASLLNINCFFLIVFIFLSFHLNNFSFRVTTALFCLLFV